MIGLVAVLQTGNKASCTGRKGLLVSGFTLSVLFFLSWFGSFFLFIFFISEAGFWQQSWISRSL